MYKGAAAEEPAPVSVAAPAEPAETAHNTAKEKEEKNRDMEANKGKEKGWGRGSKMERIACGNVKNQATVVICHGETFKNLPNYSLESY
ncbi:hypothetical protein GCM10011396_22800 [Undibacterium terreum]|uniref:Uncharacterized protein n=2 Tax=Undibacterium terreum TaxID=1224302 RepID=A0A916UJ39_9BURK|nr:hypothetical protein GCM10011396_22800 [Undibacterium terreum]